MLRPRHETLTAVDGVALQIREGEIVGYIGPNGAGKSTTIKMLLGVLHPTRGQVRVLGRDTFRERLANNQDIGVVWGQRNYLQFDVPVLTSMERFRRVYRVSRPDFDQRLKLCEEYLDIGNLLHKHARHLSLGQRMRCNLANIMLHRPHILYLDEPTIGLDVLVKQQVRKFLRHINREWGTTVVLTTHDLGDIEDLCPRILVIDKGRLLIDDTLEAVRDRLGGGVHITFNFTPGDPSLSPELLDNLRRDLPGVTARLEPGPRLVVQVPRSASAPISVIRWVVGRLEPVNLAVQEDPIEEVVRRIYTGGGTHGA